MYFSNIYGQFKIAPEQLTSLGEPTAQAVRAAALKARWEEDMAGNLHSQVIQLARPEAVQGRTEQELRFPWSDADTRLKAFRAAQPQLLVFDVHGTSPRGYTELRLSGHVAEAGGGPLYLFRNVPRPVALKVAGDLRTELQGQRATTDVLAYRLLMASQDVRTLELLGTYFPRKRELERIKWIQVYDHCLHRKGDRVVHETTLRALHDTDNPRRQYHESTLGGSGLKTLMLHALSAHSRDFYGEAGNAELDRAPTPSSRAWTLFQSFLPDVPVPEQDREGPAERRRDQGKLKATEKTPQAGEPPTSVVAGPPPAQAGGPALVVPAPVEETESTSTALEPDESADVTSRASEAPERDPWAELAEHMALDESVLRKARAALARARPLLLRGAPGTGKTMLARGLAEALCGPGNYTLVTADARWTSADVIGGLRVAPGAGLQYVFSPGVVTRAVTRHLNSVSTTGRPHALIIDEFNRANQDEAFGRLLTLLDRAYRSSMPLVSEEDGAPQKVYLPADFLLIATMNDADMARLHEIGAALSRRFVSLPVGISPQEQAFLSRNALPEQGLQLDALYDFVGTGDHTDLEHGRLRAFVPVGTYFMLEALEMVGQGQTTDEVLEQLTGPVLAGLGREALTALHGSALRGRLPAVGELLEGMLARTHF